MLPNSLSRIALCVRRNSMLFDPVLVANRSRPSWLFGVGKMCFIIHLLHQGTAGLQKQFKDLLAEGKIGAGAAAEE